MPVVKIDLLEGRSKEQKTNPDLLDPCQDVAWTNAQVVSAEEV